MGNALEQLRKRPGTMPGFTAVLENSMNKESLLKN